MTDTTTGAGLDLASTVTDAVASSGEEEIAAPRATGPLGTLVGVLFRPWRTYAGLREPRRRWWSVPVLLTVAALAAYGIVYAQANADVLYQQQLQIVDGLPQDGRVDGPASAGAAPVRMDPHPLTVGLGIGGQVVVAAFGWVAWAGLLALASTFFGQNGANFGGFFAMVTWARLPLAIRSAVQAVYMAVSGTCIYNQGLSGLVYDKTPAATLSAVRTGLGSAMGATLRVASPSRGNLVLAALLGRVDIYVVWSLVLTVAGVWSFARLPKRKALLLTLGIWVLATGVSLLPSLLGVGQGMRLF